MYKAYSEFIRKIQTYNNIHEIVTEGKGWLTKSNINTPLSNQSKLNLLGKFPNLPDDYLSFLHISDGCSLFEDLDYGGENQLFSAAELVQYNQSDDQFLRVAYIYDDYIYINLKDVSAGSNYIYVNESTSPLEYCRFLDMNFERWLERFIDESGRKFWNG